MSNNQKCGCDVLNECCDVCLPPAAPSNAAPASDVAPERVSAEDFVEHRHPEYGVGFFCTPDVMDRILATPAAESVPEQHSDTPSVPGTREWREHCRVKVAERRAAESVAQEGVRSRIQAALANKDHCDKYGWIHLSVDDAKALLSASPTPAADTERGAVAWQGWVVYFNGIEDADAGADEKPGPMNPVIMFDSAEDANGWITENLHPSDVRHYSAKKAAIYTEHPRAPKGTDIRARLLRDAEVLTEAGHIMRAANCREAAAALADRDARIAELVGTVPEIIRDICEHDPADPEHPDTVSISVTDLELVLRNWLPAAPTSGEGE